MCSSCSVRIKDVGKFSGVLGSGGLDYPHAILRVLVYITFRFNALVLVSSSASYRYPFPDRLGQGTGELVNGSKWGGDLDACFLEHRLHTLVGPH